ncbi:hypothetical protein, variant [Capsaspora owczarzaki ATCC 30864]|uniref:Uncharacterized protein n=1 Tax=Capsaspora owczarzaki (strain ATCC 30864) TaxID=595528 RepID=A0A0D2X5L9_CAPO3|nr:hypothetical protein, variant [Capsaspora owczarzaki ATCC 30864]
MHLTRVSLTFADFCLLETTTTKTPALATVCPVERLEPPDGLAASTSHGLIITGLSELAERGKASELPAALNLLEAIGPICYDSSQPQTILTPPDPHKYFELTTDLRTEAIMTELGSAPFNIDRCILAMNRFLPTKLDAATSAWSERVDELEHPTFHSALHDALGTRALLRRRLMRVFLQDEQRLAIVAQHRACKLLSVCWSNVTKFVQALHCRPLAARMLLAHVSTLRLSEPRYERVGIASGSDAPFPAPSNRSRGRRNTQTKALLRSLSPDRPAETAVAPTLAAALPTAGRSNGSMAVAEAELSDEFASSQQLILFAADASFALAAAAAAAAQEPSRTGSAGSPMHSSQASSAGSQTGIQMFSQRTQPSVGVKRRLSLPALDDSPTSSRARIT